MVQAWHAITHVWINTKILRFHVYSIGFPKTLEFMYFTYRRSTDMSIPQATCGNNKQSCRWCLQQATLWKPTIINSQVYLMHQFQDEQSSSINLTPSIHIIVYLNRISATNGRRSHDLKWIESLPAGTPGPWRLRDWRQSGVPSERWGLGGGQSMKTDHLSLSQSKYPSIDLSWSIDLSIYLYLCMKNITTWRWVYNGSAWDS